MSSDLGNLLKKARIEKGLSLDELYEATKIRKNYLKAIEDGQYQLLPGSFYAKAFIKTYSDTVGLNSEELLEMYKNSLPPTEIEQNNIEPLTAAKRSNKGGILVGKWASGILMWSFFIMIVVIIYYFANTTTSVQNPQNSLSTDNQSLRDPQNQPKPQTELPKEQTPVVKPNPTQTPAEQNVGQIQPQTPAPAAPAPSSITQVNQAGNTFTYSVAGTNKLTVEVKVIGKQCWLQINQTNNKGKLIEQGTLKTGETRTWEVQDSAWLKLGAANQVEVKVNGQVIDVGQQSTLRSFQFDLKP